MRKGESSSSGRTQKKDFSTIGGFAEAGVEIIVEDFKSAHCRWQLQRGAVGISGGDLRGSVLQFRRPSVRERSSLRKKRARPRKGRPERIR